MVVYGKDMIILDETEVYYVQETYLSTQAV